MAATKYLRPIIHGLRTQYFLCYHEPFQTNKVNT